MAQESNSVPRNATIEVASHKVYHYTSMDTFLKICSDRVLRATSIRYLNDTRERDAFLIGAQAALPRLVAKGLVDREIVKEWLGFENSYLIRKSGFLDMPFTCSFSEVDDSLSQWRSYCPGGNGVSIGFDVQSLTASKLKHAGKLVVAGEERPISSSITYEPIRYFHSQDQNFIEEEVLRLYQGAARSPLRSEFRDEGYPVELIFRVDLENAAATYKDKGFREEREHRLLVNNLFWAREALKFRAVKSTVVPYTELLIPNTAGSFNEDDNWDAIKTVTLGPSPNISLTEEAVSEFLWSVRCDAQVLKTDIPFREW